MFVRWPIKQKLLVCLCLLSGALAVLAMSGGHGVYSYRALAKGIRQRAAELPVASQMLQQVSDLRLAHQRIANCLRRGCLSADPKSVGLELRFHDQLFLKQLQVLCATIDGYREMVFQHYPTSLALAEISDLHNERQALLSIETALTLIDRIRRDPDWTIDLAAVEAMGDQLDELSKLAVGLPTFLQERMHSFADNVRIKYRALIILTWSSSLLAVGLLFLLGRLFYAWVLCPLRQLIHGSRQVACGDFSHRIQLQSQDEMAELAHAMNSMTSRFQEIRDDLDRQVQERTREVIRSEQLASVGFLAAGVAHEINNPLATIALCAESLEERMDEIVQKDDALSDDEHNEEISSLRHYLRMIQDEAFRCKDITEGLLNFSRLGNVERPLTELGALTRDVIGMLAHLGTYKGKEIDLDLDGDIWAMVNPAEFKQVLLNLATNGLDSIDPGGRVHIMLKSHDNWIRLTVTDNGCGMSEEVKRHLFEPFFTRRRGGQGTGLGMSISYRIVHEHGGTIVAESAGPGLGATIQVTLPRAQPAAESIEETDHRYQAA